MTTILDRVSDLALAPLTNTPLTSTDVTFEIADLPADISTFSDPLAIGYYAWVWDRTNYPNVGDAQRAGFAERVRVTARNVGPQTLTVTRGASPIDLNVVGVTYWLVASMNAELIEQIDDRIFDLVGGDLVTDKRVDAPSGELDFLDLIATTPGVAPLNFFEDTANGVNAISIQAPALLAGSFTIELLNALPGGLELLTIDAAGVISTQPASLVGTLDDAYDSGGPGAGRIMITDTGPAEAQGDGFQTTGLPAVYLYETTDATYNFRSAASADSWLLQRGDQDADVSDDTFETGLEFEAVNKRFGINTAGPQDLIHALQDTAGSARLRLQVSTAADDISILLQNTGGTVWEAGYDDSVAGYVIGRLSFTNPVLFLMDGDGRVGIRTVNPSAQLEIFSDTGGLINTLINQDANGRGLVIDSEATNNVLLDFQALLTGNSRGDLSLTERTTDPATTTEGDIWYNNTDKSIKARMSEEIVVATQVGIHYNGLTNIIITIAGEVSIIRGRVFVAANAATAPVDDLDSILAGFSGAGDFQDGDTIIVRRATTGETITVRDAVGNIDLNGSNVTLSNIYDNLVLQWDAVTSTWFEISRAEAF